MFVNILELGDNGIVENRHARRASTLQRQEVHIMKRSLYIIISVFVLLLTMLGAVWAVESQDEKEIRKEAAAINTTAGNAQGEKIVTQRLEKDFNVSSDRIQGLRDKKLGYGEIAITLSLCQKMPGGITDANIQQVMTMRQGPPTMGWGEITKKLGTKLGPAISQVKHVNKETNREMKHEAKDDDKEHMEKHQEQREEMHKESMGHESIGGQDMSHDKGK
jgi:hypothetical protein